MDEIANVENQPHIQLQKSEIESVPQTGITHENISLASDKEHITKLEGQVQYLQANVGEMNNKLSMVYNLLTSEKRPKAGNSWVFSVLDGLLKDSLHLHIQDNIREQRDRNYTTKFYGYRTRPNVKNIEILQSIYVDFVHPCLLRAHREGELEEVPSFLQTVDIGHPIPTRRKSKRALPISYKFVSRQVKESFLKHIDSVVQEFNASRGAHISYGRDLTSVNKACISRLKSDPAVNEVWMVGTCIKYNLKTQPSKTYRVENPLATDRVAMRIPQTGPHWYVPYSGNHGQRFNHEEDVEGEEGFNNEEFFDAQEVQGEEVGVKRRGEKEKGAEGGVTRRGEKEKGAEGGVARRGEKEKGTEVTDRGEEGSSEQEGEGKEMEEKEEAGEVRGEKEKHPQEVHLDSRDEWDQNMTWAKWVKGKGVEGANAKIKSPIAEKRRGGAEGAAANGKPNPTINSKEKGRGARAVGPTPPLGHFNTRLGRAEGAAANGRPNPTINSKENGRGAGAMGSAPPYNYSRREPLWRGTTPTPPRFQRQQQQPLQHHYQQQQHHYYNDFEQQQWLPLQGWQQLQQQQHYQPGEQHYGHYGHFGHWNDNNYNNNNYNNHHTFY